MEIMNKKEYKKPEISELNSALTNQSKNAAMVEDTMNMQGAIS